MQDRFKFRAWNKVDNKMVIEDGVEFAFHSREYQDNPIIVEGKIVLMQCTGLKDKNGKLIYEGDVVNGAKMNCGVICDNICVVEWDHEITGFKPINIYDCDCGIYNDANHMEIIGKIYENRELLEK